MQFLLWGDLLGGNPIALQHFSFYEGAARREKKLRRPSARNGAEMSGKRASDGLDGWMDGCYMYPPSRLDRFALAFATPSSLPYENKHKIRGKC